MSTLIAQLPKGFAIRPHPSVPPKESAALRCRPTTVTRRTRSDVLHILVGADSARFPQFPRRRPAR